MKCNSKLIGVMTLAVLIGVAVYQWGHYNGQTGKSITLGIEAEAAGGVVKNPAGTAPNRYVYYPGTESLTKDEVRVVACGTGMPDQRRGQASACFLFEFGNGEKMIFDLGTGSMRNISSLMIPYEYLTKIFLSHLHNRPLGRTQLDLGGRLDLGSAGTAGGLGTKRANT